MFYGCGYITDLDLSKWDVSNVTTLVHTFADCFDMVNYNFTGWDTSSVTTMDGIFNSNRALQVIDLSAFDTQNIEDFDQTFDGCSELTQVIGMDRWDTSSLKYVQQFLTGTKVKEMDLSSFNMTKATHTANMFSGNPELTTIYVSENWNLNPAQLVKADNMFSGCGKLTGANGTTTAGNPINATYGRIDLPAVKDADGNVITEAVPGYLTYKAAPVTP
jgi:surface protein